jgi:pyruvate dehydrogenase E2 component (dihydrolipoamide acetyltransferase)
MLPYVNVGVAVALARVDRPVVRGADTKSLYQIGQECERFIPCAVEGSLPRGRVDGTTFQLGMFGVDHFTAIINPPQVAIPRRAHRSPLRPRR